MPDFVYVASDDCTYRSDGRSYRNVPGMVVDVWNGDTDGGPWGVFAHVYPADASEEAFREAVENVLAVEREEHQAQAWEMVAAHY